MNGDIEVYRSCPLSCVWLRSDALMPVFNWSHDVSQSGQHRTGDHATAARASLPCLDEPITTAMFRLEQVLGLLALSLCSPQGLVQPNIRQERICSLFIILESLIKLITSWKILISSHSAAHSHVTLGLEAGECHGWLRWSIRWEVQINAMTSEVLPDVCAQNFGELSWR